MGGRPGQRGGVRPVPSDQASVPAQEGLGSDEERRPAFLCQESAQRSQPCPIDGGEGWPRLLAPQDLELVAQHQDLDLLGVARSQDEQDEREHSTDGEVGERPELVTGTIGLSHGEGGR